MNALDVFGTLFPRAAAAWCISRANFGQARRLYEAVAPSQYRPTWNNKTSGDGVMSVTGSKLRDLSRQLEENHDLVVGVFDDLVNNTIGEGADVTPMVRLKDGTLAESLNDLLLELWAEWGKYPETTGELSFVNVERQVARSYFRDGEIFVQSITDGRYPHVTGTRLALELLEADFCPFEFVDPSRNILHGIQNNDWNKALAYYVWRNHPGDPLLTRAFVRETDLKRLDAADVLHVKFSRRLRQRRGVPVVHAVINRMRDVMDYEQSERIAAKVAADLTFFVKRGAEYNGPVEVNEAGKRELGMSSGAGFFLLPGEDVGTIKSDRPNTGLEAFRNAMLRAVAAGTGTRYSSISRNYNGTYSAQRQELVEGAVGYRAQFAYLVSRFHRPVYESFVRQAALSSALTGKLGGVDLRTITRCDFRAPALPWINPSDEAKAYATLVEAKLESRAEIMRLRGRDPHKVIDELEEEQASTLFASTIQNAAAPATPEQPQAKQQDDSADAAAA